ncbi:hypothetical protein GCM10027291_46590 [Telluribacter humicola]
MVTVTIKDSYVAKDRYEVLLLDSIRKIHNTLPKVHGHPATSQLIVLEAGRVVRLVREGENNSVIALLDKGHSQRLFYISNIALAH